VRERIQNRPLITSAAFRQCDWKS